MKKERSKVFTIIMVIFIYIFVNLAIVGCFIFLESLTEDTDLEYSTKDNITVVKDKDIKIETIEGYYNEDSKCFNINAKINANVKKSFLSPNYIEIEYSLYDEEQYEINTTSINIDKIYSNNKWNKIASYCDDDAYKVSSFKLTQINMY